MMPARGRGQISMPRIGPTRGMSHARITVFELYHTQAVARVVAIGPTTRRCHGHNASKRGTSTCVRERVNVRVRERMCARLCPGACACVRACLRACVPGVRACGCTCVCICVSMFLLVTTIITTIIYSSNRSTLCKPYEYVCKYEFD
mgnify:CR=1 FL=1